ncbi:efflux RND transporter permease subunit [Lysobacter capsici]|uniref:efflux RND transporter permease subunit n=1 Tax=Lysobacter capsici TaxID=435897 RepID=UPI00398CC67C
MNLSAPFVRRPIGTVLLTIGLALSGVAAFFNLPVSPLPQVDFPTVSVSANLPGASLRPWPRTWPRRWNAGWARSPTSPK